jgi:hypothetical protein
MSRLALAVLKGLHWQLSTYSAKSMAQMPGKYVLMYGLSTSYLWGFTHQFRCQCPKRVEDAFQWALDVIPRPKSCSIYDATANVS